MTVRMVEVVLAVMAEGAEGAGMVGRLVREVLVTAVLVLSGCPVWEFPVKGKSSNEKFEYGIHYIVNILILEEYKQCEGVES